MNKNPAKWELKNESFKIAVLNIHSVLNKAADIRTDDMLKFADVICFSETWLKDDEQRPELELPGYEQHINSYGDERGKGVAVLYKVNSFKVSGIVKLKDLQITHLTSHSMDVIAIYRSSRCQHDLEYIVKMIDMSKTVIICGDFNLCFRENKSHRLVQSLIKMGFTQNVKAATHIDGGTIDHVYHRDGRKLYDVDVSIYSPYYTAFDHDALCVTLKEKVDKES